MCDSEATRQVDEAEIKKEAERRRVLEQADRSARAILNKAKKAEKVNYQKLVTPIIQKRNADAAKALVQSTINAFKQVIQKPPPSQLPTQK